MPTNRRRDVQQPSQRCDIVRHERVVRCAQLGLLQLLHELRPGIETRLARDQELRIGELRIVRTQIGRAKTLDRLDIGRSDGFEQVFRELALLL